MSDDHDAAGMIERLASRVALPADFFGRTGAVGTRWEDLRQFPRFYFRTAAALEVQPSLPALSRSQAAERVYVKDISRGRGHLALRAVVSRRASAADVDRRRRAPCNGQSLPPHPGRLLRGRRPVRSPRSGPLSLRISGVQSSLITPAEVAANPHASM